MTHEPKPKRSYVGIVTAKPGALLLGGTPRHESVRFEAEVDAKRWTVVIVMSNVGAGRLVDEAFVEPRNGKPEVRHEP